MVKLICSYLLVLCLLLMLGCDTDTQKAQAQARVPVKAMHVLQQDTILYRDFIGEVTGSQVVEVRSQVNGVLLEKHFNDGALVNEGDLLFSIDARELNAELAVAEARLSAARASLAQARQDVERYKPLLEENAIARQVFDNAIAMEEAARAEVNANEALVEQSQVAAAYAEVVAPLTGRVGAAEVSVGDLISAGSTLLVEISDDDPAWVNFNTSETDLLAYLQGDPASIRGDEVQEVILTLSDNNEYLYPGRINFSDRALDPHTATYRVRAEFPNPDNLLRPGLFARIRVQGASISDALLIPDRAVTQLLNHYFVTVVDASGKAEQRSVIPAQRAGALWIIQEGLDASDVVVVEGFQKAPDGALLDVTMITLDELTSADET